MIGNSFYSTWVSKIMKCQGVSYSISEELHTSTCATIRWLSGGSQDHVWLPVIEHILNSFMGVRTFRNTFIKGTHIFPRAWRTPNSNLSCAPTNGQHEPRRWPLNICAWYQQLQNEKWTAESFFIFSVLQSLLGETHPAFAGTEFKEEDQCLGTHPLPPLS